jgi:hypothetical protein
VKGISLDNGTEFSEMKQQLKSKNIRVIQNSTYNPRANGIVEHTNKKVRDILRRMFVANNNLIWYDKVSDIEDILNNSFIKSLKGTPHEIMNSEQLQNEQKEINKNRRKQFLNESHIPVGSFVRIDMSSIFSGVRKAQKEETYKNIQIRYTPFTFQVIKKSSPKNSLSRPKYTVQNTTTKKIIDKKFFANELQVTEFSDIFSEEKQRKLLARAHRLNGTHEIKKNDLEII